MLAACFVDTPTTMTTATEDEGGATDATPTPAEDESEGDAGTEPEEDSSGDGTTPPADTGKDCSGQGGFDVINFVDAACGPGTENFSCTGPNPQDCTSVPCKGGPTQGVVRPAMNTSPEGLMRGRTLEVIPPAVDGGSMVADFEVDVSGTCNPQFITEVFCGFAPECDIDYLVQVWDADSDFTMPLAQQTGLEVFDGKFTPIVIPLGQWQDIPLVISLTTDSGPDYVADDIGVFDNPRVMATN